MESSTEAADRTARTFSQVVFTDTPYSYPPLTPITCCYTLTGAFQPNPRDWVGIFKVGWSITKDYHTFVWVEPCLDLVRKETATRQVFFKDYYLPKDEIEFYQFCYVDSAGQVRGASTPFCFRSPEEQCPESSVDDDLLVITTQEQVEQSIREKVDLQKELDKIREENETLKNDLQKEQQEAASLKGLNDQKEKEITQLVKDMDQVKEQNENLTSTLQLQGKEMDTLKEEMLTQMAMQMETQQQDASGLNDQKEKEITQLVKDMDQVKEQNENLTSTLQLQGKEMDTLKEEMLTQMAMQMETQQQDASEQNRCSQSLNLDRESRQNETHAQEKYDRALMKVNLLKVEREELKGKVDAQSVEISILNSKLREQEVELLNTKDITQLLQVDLQSSEKDKERLYVELQMLQSLTHNMDGLKRENQELCRRLSQQETPQNCPDDDLRAQCQTLVTQLQDVQIKLMAEKEETKNTKRQVEFLENAMLQDRDQMEKLALSCEQAQLKSGKQELQLAEAHEGIADMEGNIEENNHLIMLLRHEKEEMANENQSLINDIEGLRRAYTESPHMQPETTSPAATDSTTHDWQQQETPEQPADLYENIESAEDPEQEALLCRHCQECFPYITQHELEQHEQSHRVCPFCTMICDNMEQSVYEDHVYGHEL
ncbi:calcium-binding and coiled-coil domain-containing protein 2 isoform X2 [Cottoperca gobio]|uniref:Calcium-binding and coiled-coil domain-containing protein 2 isoform X2 n=1 Tax=Cottoperca gobio TaxID=56716 RepID=A0A6J2RLZ7_COTGO|nr:calcium-binding and coiled-coil domain-containing protein 2 isoform X2 [Cottoperca gobio]